MRKMGERADKDGETGTCMRDCDGDIVYSVITDSCINAKKPSKARIAQGYQDSNPQVSRRSLSGPRHLREGSLQRERCDYAWERVLARVKPLLLL